MTIKIGNKVMESVIEDGWFEKMREEVRQSIHAKRSGRVEGKKIGRNDPCPCGSGKKYKKCCLKYKS